MRAATWTTKLSGSKPSALGKFRNREDLVAAIRKAQRLPAEEPKVRNLLLNQRVSPVSTLISRAEWTTCAGEVEFVTGEQVLSSTIDLTALVLAASDPARIRSFFWIPVDTLRAHSNRDFGAGNQRYVEWVNAPHMFTTPGRSIDPNVIPSSPV